jgi:hypothetical protein
MVDIDAPMFLDVTEDLQRVDGVMTRLVKDRTLWQEFLDDPNGVMIQLGLHPPTTEEINARVNRAMWATLGDRELLQMLEARYRTFSPERLDEIRRYFLDGLREGVIRHDTKYDHQALKHLLDDEVTTRRILRRTIVLMQEADALEGRYGDYEIDAYLDRLMDALREGTPVDQHPVLESWDDYYGVGREGGGQLYGEGAAVVTIFVAVQGLAYITAVVDVGFWGVVAERSLNDAISGDEEALRAITLLGRVLDLGSEALVHAQNLRLTDD